MDDPIRPRASVPTADKPRVRPLRSGEWRCWNLRHGREVYVVAETPSIGLAGLQGWARGDGVALSRCTLWGIQEGGAR